jgi:hypothetical protein
MSMGESSMGWDDWDEHEDLEDAPSVHTFRGHLPYHRPSGLPDLLGPHDHRDVSALPATLGSHILIKHKMEEMMD